MAKVYVGCALTGAPQEFVRTVEAFKTILRSAGHEVTDFLGLTAGTPYDVYEMDIHRCVAGCEVMIGICDLPSIGLGWELGTAVEKHQKPTMALVGKDSGVTRLVVGAECDRNPYYNFLRYDDFEHMCQLALDFIKQMEAEGLASRQTSVLQFPSGRGV